MDIERTSKTKMDLERTSLSSIQSKQDGDDPDHTQDENLVLDDDSLDQSNFEVKPIKKWNFLKSARGAVDTAEDNQSSS